MKLLPRGMNPASIILGLVSAAIVVGSVCLDVQDTSPGPIAAVHAQLPELLDTNNCARCHGDASVSMTDACLDCHQVITQQLEDERGFHGLMERRLANDCSKCHSDHHGHDFPITNGRSFELAGIKSSEQVHDGLDYQLTGKHTSLACESCHPNARVAVLEKGSTRFIGLDQSCTSCHEDVHKGSYGHDCSSCHGQEHAFKTAAEFKHTSSFELIGSHSPIACSVCHEEGTATAVDVLLSTNGLGAAHRLAVRTCVECHPSPHSIDFIEQVSASLATPWQQSCEHCHPPTHSAFHGPEATLSVELHACTGFSLVPPHERVACAGCHEGFGKLKEQQVRFQASFPGRHADDCQACHGDPHYGQFEKGPFRGQGCLACHVRHSFTSDFDSADHGSTAFPLHGAHRSVACDKCHKVDPNPPPVPTGVKEIVARIFHGTPNSCRACHADPHKGQFASPEFLHADCDACHDELSFRHPTFDLAAHARTSFPLTGAHQAVGCNSCHVDSGPGTDENLSPHEIVGIAESRRVFHGTSQECTACHKDVHDGMFDGAGLPTVLNGHRGCARCHTTVSFSGVRGQIFDGGGVTRNTALQSGGGNGAGVNGFDHGRWTGYPLIGAHAKAACADCHRREQPDELGRTFGKVRSRNCQSCHVDPHVGQFGPTKTVNCSKCHVEGDSFSELRFDHQAHSTFRLDETHVGLACAACHKPQTLSDGQTAIRYKPLGTKCGDCHVPRGPRP